MQSSVQSVSFVSTVCTIRPDLAHRLLVISPVAVQRNKICTIDPDALRYGVCYSRPVYV